MKKVLILLILVFMVSASSCTKGENKNEKGFVKALNTIDDQFTYAYIYDLIFRLRADSMKIDEELAIQAIRDAFKDSAKINPAIRQQIILAMQDSIRDRSIAKS
ncbi:MAG: hypothetical protein NTW25_04365, partial [Candidatus Kapabacteria bacterium]|nr:hypothetical protein [Candidatus Kapabacteria bacterium]